VPIKSCMIGIAGPSCSGKTRLAEQLVQLLGEQSAVVISLDAYYRDLSRLDMASRERRNVDVPQALEYSLLARQMKMLANGENIHIPVYDYALHVRSEKRVEVSPRDIIIVEGLFALYWKEIRDLFLTRVFIDIDDRIAYDRRIKRDLAERGSTLDYVTEHYKKNVRPMCEKYVLPTREHAHMVVRGDEPVEKSADLALSHLKRGIRIR